MLLFELSSSRDLVARAFWQLPIYAKVLAGLTIFAMSGVILFATWAFLKMLIHWLGWRSRPPYYYPGTYDKLLTIANSGDALACYKIGEHWRTQSQRTWWGQRHSRKYYRKARRLFAGQAAHYDPFARFMLGEIYSKKYGQTVWETVYFTLRPKRFNKICERHYYKSRILYTEKAEHKTADAFRNLAILNENGWGGDYNKILALDHYKKAADLGDFASQHQAAHMLYADGKPDEAAHYYLLAAKNPQGATGEAKKAQVDIQMFLGDVYRDGIGRPVSLEEAYFWYSIAASRGKSEAVTERLKLESGMETKMKITIQRRLKEFHRHLQN